MKLCSVRQKNRFFSFHFMQAQAQNKDAILIIFKTQAFTDFISLLFPVVSATWIPNS